jgi:potassium-transporting ATPase KdpC subunit
MGKDHTQNHFSATIRLFFLLTLLTGFFYPICITIFAQFVFPGKANGSLLEVRNQTVGSEWIGQSFEGSRYFSSRPSAVGYQPWPSGASNLAPSNKELQKQIAGRKIQLELKNGHFSDENWPADLIFASGSGLDPHISPKAAQIQISRIVKYRMLNQEQARRLSKLVDESVEGREFCILGEPRVNVLKINLKLDQIFLGQ